MTDIFYILLVNTLDDPITLGAVRGHLGQGHQYIKNKQFFTLKLIQPLFTDQLLSKYINKSASSGCTYFNIVMLILLVLKVK
jgi:hypothetical protein